MKRKRDKQFGLYGPTASIRGRLANRVNTLLRPLNIRLERIRIYPNLFQRALNHSRHPFVVEVGAFYPGHTVEKLRSQGYDPDFILFEPSSFGFDGLNKAYASDERIRVENSAVGDFDGEVAFEENDYGGASSVLQMTGKASAEYPWMANTRERTVPCIRLDSYFGDDLSRDIDLLIVDVQGYEDRVLRGAEQTLARTRNCLVEISVMSSYEDGARPEKTLQLLTDAGFDMVGNSPVWGSSETGDLWELDALFQKVR